MGVPLPDLKIYPNPQLGPAEIKLSRGLNLNDNLLEMDREDACLLQNLVWTRNTLTRRKGFRQYFTGALGTVTKWRGGIEYVDRWGNRRTVVATDSGRVAEVQSPTVLTDIKTGLATLQEVHFAPAFGSLFYANGQDALRKIDGNSVAGTACTDRVMGPPVPITGVGIAAGAAGAPNGTYLGIVTAVREEAGIKVLESDWSNLPQVTVVNARLVFTWSATADTRATHYYIYHTSSTGSVLYYAGKVAVGTLTLTDNTTDASLIQNRIADQQYRNGVPPVGEFVVSGGGRLMVGALASQPNAVAFGVAGSDSFVIENFPVYDAANLKTYQGGNYTVMLPGQGKVKAGRAIGETGDKSARANSTWIAQETSCYLLPDSNPNNPLQEISSQIGCIGQRAHAQYGQGIFFQSRRGVEFWPGSGQYANSGQIKQVIYLVSDQITPVFNGGGNQNLTANQSDADIRYTVDGDTLLITVRDSASKACANKVYALDLLRFMKAFQGAVGPGDLQGQAFGRWAGPWVGNGYGLFIPQSNRGLLLLDNQDITLLYRHATSYSDWVGGANATVSIRILGGPCMHDFKMARNKLHYLDLFAFTNTDSSLRLIGDNGTYDQAGITIQAVNYTFPWSDLTWDDLTWQYNTWHSEVCLPWSAIANFFQLDITNNDPAGDFVFYAYALRYSSAIRTRTFR